MKRAFVFLMAALGIVSAAAQERISAQLFLKRTPQVLNAGAEVFEVESPVLRTVATLPGRTLEISDFPIAIGQTGTLLLERKRSVVDGETQWWIGVRAARDGQPEQLKPFSGPTQYSLAGYIVGEPDSRVWISIIGGQLYAIVQRSDGAVYSLEPTATPNAKSTTHIMTSTDRQDNLWHWTCRAAELPEYAAPSEIPQKHPADVLDFPTLLQARVAVETTSSLYQRLGRSTARVASYIAAVFSMVSRIYEDEVNITLTISWSLIWTAPPEGDEDPYQNDSDISALLSEVARYWNNNRATVARDVVHVMTAPSSTDVGGIARLASLCQRSQGYSVSGIQATYSYPTLNYTWDVMVVAHEIGHTFGARHTHDCWWAPPLDTCVTQDGNPPIADACYKSPITPRRSWNGGSIMSYCHLVQPSVTLTFRPQVTNVIRSTLAAGCLRRPSAPIVLIQHPVGNQQLTGGSPVEVRWTSSQVQTVAIEYSSDSLRSWTRIASNITASNRSYMWTPPRQLLPAVWLRVISESDPLVADTTLASFSIVVPSLELTSPRGGEHYGFGERLLITWTQTLVSNVRVLFSADAGTDWDTLASNTSAQQYQWTIPAQPTTNAVIRIESTTDPAVFSQSQAFAIGQPTIELLVPNGGERWVVGSQQTIQWHSDFVNRIRIDYSTDAGKNWRLIQLSYDATQQQVAWQIPNTPTDSALVRIRYSADPTIAVQSARPFSIVASSSTQAVAEPEQLTVGLLSSMVDGDRLWLKVTTSDPIPHLALTVVTMLGQPIASATEQWVPSGETVLTIPLPSETATGAYILAVQAGAKRWAFPFVRMQH